MPGRSPAPWRCNTASICLDILIVLYLAGKGSTFLYSKWSKIIDVHKYTTTKLLPTVVYVLEEASLSSCPNGHRGGQLTPELPRGGLLFWDK